MKQLFIISFFTVTTLGFSQESSLKSSSTINKVFNNSEIEDLEKILTFFEGQICSFENKNDSNINSCYDSFILRMTNSVDSDYLKINIPFEKQKILYEEIKESTFNKIWQISWSVPIPPSNRYLKSIGKDTLTIQERENLDTLNYLQLKYKSKYISFLKKYGKESPIIKHYHKAFYYSGGISPSMVSSIIINFDYYDIKDIRMKLIFAIHYLTLNDQRNRSEKYKKPN